MLRGPNGGRRRGRGACLKYRPDRRGGLIGVPGCGKAALLSTYSRDSIALSVDELFSMMTLDVISLEQENEFLIITIETKHFLENTWF
jgi:hypothetical protein